MKTSMGLINILILGSISGCIGNLSNYPFEEDLAFVQALPDSAALYVETPDAEGEQASSQKCDAISMKTGLSSDACDPDLLRTWTFDTTSDVNSFIFNVLELLDRIRSAEPDLRTQNSRVWGPWYLEDMGFYVRLEVVRSEPVFTYDLTLSYYADRERDVLLSGSWAPGSVADEGRGEFVYDYDVQALYFDDASQTGNLVVQYDTTGTLLDLEVSAYNLKDPDTGEEIDKDYAYYSDGKGGGYFYFHSLQDVYSSEDASSPKKESITLWSVWDASNAGRADLEVTEGDLDEMVYSGVECWTPEQVPVYSIFPGCEATGDAAFCVGDAVGWNEE